MDFLPYLRKGSLKEGGNEILQAPALSTKCATWPLFMPNSEERTTVLVFSSSLRVFPEASSRSAYSIKDRSCRNIFPTSFKKLRYELSQTAVSEELLHRER